MSAKRKPPGWRKALANVSVGVDAWADCSVCGHSESLGDQYCRAADLVFAFGLCMNEGLDPDRWTHKPWTYDREGNWTCPTCNKKGGEE